MNNSVGMQVLKGHNDLHCIALNFEFMKSFPSLKELIHTLVLAQLKKDVDVFAVFKEMLEVTYIVVLDTPVDFDLAH